MVNQEHLAILRQGVEEWNQWRKEHDDILQPDLRQANLSVDDFYGTSIIKIDFKKDFLSGVTISNADLILLVQLHFC